MRVRLLMAEGRPPVDGNERWQSLTLRLLRLQRPVYGAYLSAGGAGRAPAHDPGETFAVFNSAPQSSRPQKH